MPKKKNVAWKGEEPNENKAPVPPCGKRHAGQCHIGPNCDFKTRHING